MRYLENLRRIKQIQNIEIIIELYSLRNLIFNLNAALESLMHLIADFFNWGAPKFSIAHKFEVRIRPKSETS
jgi:hypothetical protein